MILLLWLVSKCLVFTWNCPTEGWALFGMPYQLWFLDLRNPASPAEPGRVSGHQAPQVLKPSIWARNLGWTHLSKQADELKLYACWFSSGTIYCPPIGSIFRWSKTKAVVKCGHTRDAICLAFFVCCFQNNMGEIRPQTTLVLSPRYVGGPILLKGPSRGNSHVWSLMDFLTLLRRTGQMNGDIVWMSYHKFSLQF